MFSYIIKDMGNGDIFVSDRKGVLEHKRSTIAWFIERYNLKTQDYWLARTHYNIKYKVYIL